MEFTGLQGFIAMGHGQEWSIRSGGPLADISTGFFGVRYIEERIIDAAFPPPHIMAGVWQVQGLSQDFKNAWPEHQFQNICLSRFCH